MWFTSLMSWLYFAMVSFGGFMPFNLGPGPGGNDDIDM